MAAGSDGEEARPTIADLAAAGLYEPDAPEAADRLALLDYLLDLGATLDDLIAESPDGLPILGTTLGLWSTRERLTVADAIARSGLDEAVLARVWRAAGFPDPAPDAPVFNPLDVQLFANLKAAIDFLGEDAIVQLVRVLGAAAARVADAAVSVFVVNIGPSLVAQDPSGLALARANVEAMEFLPGLVAGFDILLRHHMDSARRPIDPSEERRGIEVQHRSIGFVDMVGSTVLAQQLDDRALAAALSEFDELASEIVTGRGARVVKLIGDEVMFAAEDPHAAVVIALALVDTFAAHAVLPPVRGAVATGEVFARDGDYSGVVVNLAARVAKIARPSSVLIDEATRTALGGDAFAFSDAGMHRLKGFESRVHVYRVRPPTG